jgi:aminoglycoside 3-N-acetyltransferase
MCKMELTGQLRDLGLRAGDAVMVHSSFKSLGIRDPETVILALLDVLGDRGTLMMPALSYLQDPPTVHDTRSTPSCVGYLAEYFRRRPGTVRSVHPTHSVCAPGGAAAEWLGDHILDDTPCGPHSPFSKLALRGGKILMLGCGLEPNTTMHAVEEHIRPPYLFGPPLTYTITDGRGNTFRKDYIPHDFRGVVQRYDRVDGILDGEALRTGAVGNGKAYLFRSDLLFEAALEKLSGDPWYFVDRTP